MRRCSLTTLAIAVTFVISLVVAAGAQAVVVKMGAAGRAGVSLVPGTSTAGLSTVTSSKCSDPWLSADLGGPALPPGALCWNGGSVMHRNETFAITWDPKRSYWATTRDYVEQFMKDVANGSGTLSSPYALTTQYNDSTGRAANDSKYGGGCVDYGVPAPCLIGSSSATLPGLKYPANGCPASGSSYEGGPSASNGVCLTDAQLQPELHEMINRLQAAGNVASGYTPMLVLLTPPGVEVCLNGAGTLCSANSTAATQFCSYHSYVTGTDFAYVVQPWTPYTGCDEPKLPALPQNATNIQVARDAGSRLVNPLSQGEIASIVNPQLNGWSANDGSEMSDNGCTPNGPDYDTETVGGASYVLQRDFNNAGVIESDPSAPACAPWVVLAPAFVVPSAVNAGDVVAFDGSTTNSTLIVPSARYQWSFGDGTKAVGPSVVHSYAKGGTYNVTLTVTDRGGNQSSLTEAVQVIGGGNGGGGGQSPGSSAPGGFKVHVQLMPQGLKAVLRSGIALRVNSTKPANGIASVSITRGAARHAHIKAGHGPAVVIARGTLSSIKAGTVNLRLHLRGSITKRLRHDKHLTLTIRLALVAADGGQVTVDAAGRY
jgi:hypothetical protein